MKVAIGIGAVMLAAAVSLTGCGGGGTKVSTDPQLLANAYNSTTAAGSADESMAIDVTLSSGAITTIHAQGAFQWHPLLGAMTESLAAASTSLSLPVRLVGTDLYVELPAQARSQMGGKPWLEASISDLIGSSGVNQFDPTQELALLSGRAKSIQKIGAATVAGQPTTHYQAVIDLSKGATTPLLKEMIPKLEASLGVSELPVDVWIDSAGRLVEMKLTMTLKTPPSGASSTEAAQYPITEDIVETLSHYGVSVTVSAPPADQVSSFNLAQALQNSGL